jgi:hypothetical protein
MATTVSVSCDNCIETFDGDDEQYFEEGWLEVRTTLDGPVFDFCCEQCLVEY